MAKKSTVAALIGLGTAAVAGAAAAVVYQKYQEQKKLEAQLAAEEAILLDLDGDGEVDAMLEDLDGDGTYDTVTVGASVTEASEPAKTPAEAENEITANEEVPEVRQQEGVEAETVEEQPAATETQQ